MGKGNGMTRAGGTPGNGGASDALRQKQLDAYNEARSYVEAYLNWKGDKRKAAYRKLANDVADLWQGRMNNFGKKLGLPTAYDIYDEFYKKK